MNLRFKHFLTMNGCVNNAVMMEHRERYGHKIFSDAIFQHHILPIEQS